MAIFTNATSAELATLKLLSLLIDELHGRIENCIENGGLKKSTPLLESSSELLWPFPSGIKTSRISCKKRENLILPLLGPKSLPLPQLTRTVYKKACTSSMTSFHCRWAFFRSFFAD